MHRCIHCEQILRSIMASVGCRKNIVGIVTRIVLETSDVKFTEVLAASVLAQNEMDRVRGFSRAQWALGRAQEMGSINFRQRQRNARAELSGTSARGGNSKRRMAECTQRRTTEGSISSKNQTPGTFQTWRRSGLLETRQKQTCATTHQRQVSRKSCKSMKETNTENRQKSSGSLTRETLIKCALEQSKFSSERARQLEHGTNCRGTTNVCERPFEDLSMDALPDEDKTCEDPERVDHDSSGSA